MQFTVLGKSGNKLRERACAKNAHEFQLVCAKLSGASLLIASISSKNNIKFISNKVKVSYYIVESFGVFFSLIVVDLTGLGAATARQRSKYAPQNTSLFVGNVLVEVFVKNLIRFSKLNSSVSVI